MATHPEDPRNPESPEPAHSDPHAEPAGKHDEPDAIEPVVQRPSGAGEESDSAIELGLSPGSADILSDSDLHPPIAESGITSGIAWAALMEELPEPTDEIRVDSPSDVDLLKPHAPPKGRPHVSPETTLIGPPADLESFPPHRPGMTAPPAVPQPPAADPFEPRDIFTAEPTGRYPRPDTGLGAAGQSAVTPPTPSDSARVDLGAPSRPPSSSGVESSIIDLGAIDFPVEPTPSGVIEEVELVSESSGIDLAAEGPVSNTGSGRDLIAEALESGIKFGPPPEPSDMGAAASSVEPPRDFVPPPAAPDAPQKPAASPFSSAIEFGGPAPAASPFSSAIEFGGPGPAAPAPPPPPPPASRRPPTGSAISSAIEYGEEGNSALDSSSSVNLDKIDAGGGSPPPFEFQTPPAKMPPGRPPTLQATPEQMEASIRTGNADRMPTDSEVDLGSHPSSGDFEPFEGPGSPRPAKTGSDSDIDINIGELPEESGAPGSGLFVNANSGRLEPTDAAIDLDSEPGAEEEPLAEEAAVAEAEAKPPEKKTAARKESAKIGGGRLSRFIGPGLGALGGAAAVVVLQFLGIGVSSTPSKTQPITQSPPPSPVVPPPAPAAGPALSKFELLQNGDLDKAASAGIEQVDETNPEQLGQRGEYRWLAYLQKQRRARAPLNAADPAVKLAAADLQAAADKNNADALFWLGHLQESTNAPDKAKAAYAKGASESKDPLQKRRFEAALRRLELREDAKPAGAARGPDAAEALLLALVALQAQAPAAAPAVDGDEAGFGFWDAARLAREQKYAEAVQALDKARELHDQRRFSRLRKAQNPLSDPTEEVFLRCADELKAYWQLQEKLRTGGYLDVAAHRDPVKAVDELLAKSKDGSGAKAMADKLAKERQEIEANLAKAAADAKAAKDESAAKLKAADERATAEETKLKAALEQARAEETKLKAAEGRERELAAGKAAADTELKKVAEELVKAKLLDPKAGKDALLPGLQSAIKLAAAADSQGLIRTLQGDVNRFRRQLNDRWRPGEMLVYWLPLLQDRSRTDLADKAVLDAERVANDADATPTEKARASAVYGLALRNQGKFTEAKAALENAKAGLEPADNVWRDRVTSALSDVADPAAYYLARAEELQNRGKPAEAVAELEKAEKAYPAGKSRFLAQRGLLELEKALTKSPDRIAPNDPALQAARKDADEAAKTGDAFALYAAGRVAEESGEYDSAIASYRKAVAAHPARDAAGSRYRLALARALTRASAAPEGQKPAAKAGESTGRAAPQLETALLVLTVLFQGPTSPANQSEATQLADEILASPESTLEMRAQALAIKGMYTQALLTYADALRPSLTREQVATLKELIQSHPALRRPDSQAIPTPQEAERHYATGLRLLYSGQYAAAEKELLAAVAQDSQDARYYYFLGLSRLYQGKRDAFEDFEQGARLEQQALPSKEAVDSALERVQGPARRTIDSARMMPR